MATFTPPIDMAKWQVSRSELTQWIYQIWSYLQTNPIVSEDTVGQIIEDYLDTHPIPGNVASVNGETGAVVLTAEDIETTEAGTSVQDELNETRAAATSASGVASSANTKADQALTSVSNLANQVDQIDDDVIDINIALDNKYSDSNPPPYPVTSVNGATGKVSVNSIIDNANNARAQATGGSSAAGLIFGSLDSIYGYLMFNNSYDLTIRSNTNQYLGQVYTTLDPPPAKIPFYSASIGSGTVDIPSNTMCVIYGLRFPLTGSLPTGNTAILQFTSPNLNALQPLNASVSSGYIQTTLSRGSNYLYLTVTNNIPGESFSGSVTLYLFSTVTTTLTVVNE